MPEPTQNANPIFTQKITLKLSIAFKMAFYCCVG